MRPTALPSPTTTTTQQLCNCAWATQKPVLTEGLCQLFLPPAGEIFQAESVLVGRLKGVSGVQVRVDKLRFLRYTLKQSVEA